MSHWNYRVMERIIPVGDGKVYEYFISEVYYERGKPKWYSDPMNPFGQSEEELKEDIERMLKAFDKPVLEEW